MSDQYVRLYLTPSNGTQQVIDVDVNSLILSNGAFVSPQTASSITLSGAPYTTDFSPFGFAPVTDQQLSMTYQDEFRICWREPVGTDQYPNENVIIETDPSGGVCVCGVTCLGTNLSYVIVKSVTEQLGY
jgi:hypothetical protein